MSIAKESLPFVLGIGALALVGGVGLHPAVAVACLPPLLFTLWFFRDPERSTPQDADTLFAPADGKIIVAGPEKLSIFMNVFNVHVCRTPLAGRVERIEHHRGRFLAAYKDAASEHNERVSIVVSDGSRRIRFTLVAGLVAKRIVCKVSEGQSLVAGERIGLIRFGSRVDVDLPEGARPAVSRGQRVVAGETPIAGLTAAPAGEFGYSGKMVLESAD